MSGNSKAKSSLPEWLTNSFLEDHLRGYYKNNDIKLTGFEVKTPSGKDEGFTGSMLRTKVNFSVPGENEDKSLNLIIKMAASEEILDAFANYNLYDREIEFYCDVAPKIGEKLKELGEVQLLPDSIGVCKTRKIMIMEDLGAKGYGVLPALPGYNISQTKAILKRMAALHAIGAVLQEENPNIFANFKNGNFSRDVDVFNDMYAGTFDGLLETISTWPDLSKYTEKLSRVRESIVERLHRIYDVNPNHFNTLIHDDLWPPNIMLKTDNPSEEQPFENVIFIDFQMTFWSSPTIDLYFFLNTSVCESFRPHRFDELVEFYHQHLVEFLRRLKYKKHIPTWTEFQEQYKERQLLAFIISCLEQAITVDNNGEVGIDVLLKNDENAKNVKRSLFQKEKVQLIVRKMIPYYDQIGMFD